MIKGAKRMKNLKSCPFCGSDARVSYLLGYGFLETKVIYQISCDRPCKVNPSVTAYTMEEAEREWNRRVEHV